MLLYKLCYYTTPFEEHGPLAIVNAKYTFPSMPVYPPPLQHLIGRSRRRACAEPVLILLSVHSIYARRAAYSEADSLSGATAGARAQGNAIRERLRRTYLLLPL